MNTLIRQELRLRFGLVFMMMLTLRMLCAGILLLHFVLADRYRLNPDESYSGSCRFFRSRDLNQSCHWFYILRSEWLFGILVCIVRR